MSYVHSSNLLFFCPAILCLVFLLSAFLKLPSDYLSPLIVWLTPLCPSDLLSAYLLPVISLCCHGDPVHLYMCAHVTTGLVQVKAAWTQMDFDDLHLHCTRILKRTEEYEGGGQVLEDKFFSIFANFEPQKKQFPFVDRYRFVLISERKTPSTSADVEKPIAIALTYGVTLLPLLTASYLCYIPVRWLELCLFCFFFF